MRSVGILAQVKTGALTLLSTLTRVASEEMARSLPDTVPALTAAMADAKRQVQVRRAGRPALLKLRVFASHPNPRGLPSPARVLLMLLLHSPYATLLGVPLQALKACACSCGLHAALQVDTVQSCSTDTAQDLVEYDGPLQPELQWSIKAITSSLTWVDSWLLGNDSARF